MFLRNISYPILYFELSLLLNSASKNEIPDVGLTSGYFYFEEAIEVFPLVIEVL